MKLMILLVLVLVACTQVEETPPVQEIEKTPEELHEMVVDAQNKLERVTIETPSEVQNQR